jgi:hypothetical protein
MTTGLKVALLGFVGAALGYISAALGATTIGPVVGFTSCVVMIGGIAAHQLQKKNPRE